MSIETVRVPDLGGAEEVEVIELTVAEGDSVEVEQTLLVLESEKATMELPAPVAGVVKKILVAEGDKIEREGQPLMEIAVSSATDQGRSGTPPPCCRLRDRPPRRSRSRYGWRRRTPRDRCGFRSIV